MKSTSVFIVTATENIENDSGKYNISLLNYDIIKSIKNPSFDFHRSKLCF